MWTESRAHVPFCACRNELKRQAGLRYVPDRPEARRFASLDRPRIVSWLVEVVAALKLSEEALHAAVSLLDRFVAGTEVSREHWRLGWQVTRFPWTSD